MLSILCFIPQRSHYNHFLQCDWSGEITRKECHLAPVHCNADDCFPAPFLIIPSHRPIHKSEFQQLFIVSTGVENLNENAYGMLSPGGSVGRHINNILGVNLAQDLLHLSSNGSCLHCQPSKAKKKRRNIKFRNTLETQSCLCDYIFC